MSSKKDYLEHIIEVLEDKLDTGIKEYSDLENTIADLKAEIEAEIEADSKPVWYKIKPFKKGLCWVNNYVENPTEGDEVRLIIGYDENMSHPFNANGYRWKYVTPMSREKLLEYSLEEQ